MKVEWTESATADLEAIRGYIGRDSRYYAACLVDRVVKATRAVGTFPELGQVVRQFEERRVRERVVGNYRILYEVQKNRVLIIAVVHAARDIGSLSVDP